jgi:hypothetical protein
MPGQNNVERGSREWQPRRVAVMQRHGDAEPSCLTVGLVKHALRAVETMDMMSRLLQKDRQTASSAAEIDDRCRRCLSTTA